MARARKNRARNRMIMARSITASRISSLAMFFHLEE